MSPHFYEIYSSFNKFFLLLYFAIASVFRNLSQVVGTLFADNDHMCSILTESAGVVVRVIIIGDFELRKTPLTVKVSIDALQKLEP